MTGISKIPDKVERVDMISGVDFVVDTKGLNCIFKAVGGDISITLREGDYNCFLLCDGESLDFCGKIYFKHAAGNPTAYCLYYHTL
jgi:hypothetical protein